MGGTMSSFSLETAALRIPTGRERLVPDDETVGSTATGDARVAAAPLLT